MMTYAQAWAALEAELGANATWTLEIEGWHHGERHELEWRSWVTTGIVGGRHFKASTPEELIAKVKRRDDPEARTTPNDVGTTTGIESI